MAVEECARDWERGDNFSSLWNAPIRGSRNKYDQFNTSLKKSDSQAAEEIGTPESIPEYDRPPLRKIDHYLRPEIPHLSKRVTVALLSCIGFIIMFGMRTSMGLVKIKMTNTTWDTKTLSEVDAAIFWGYFVTQIPGGLIAAAYPANRLFGAAIGSSCILNLIIPFVYTQPDALILIKVMQGLVEGVTYPACHGIMRHWAPPLERSKLATLAFSGCYAGVMFSMPISGELIEHYGPLAPFYFYGTIGIFWYLAWLWLIFEKPSYHTCIDTKELNYIESSLGGTQQHYVTPTLTNTPWKSFFTSLPCYAIFVANFCRSWNFYLLVLFQASYFKDAFNSTMTENAFLGALPHLLMTIVVPTGGILADRIRKNGILTTTQVRKLFNCGGFGMEATFFIIMAYSSTITQGMTALTIGVAFSGFAISGFNVNHLDIAPRYASILMGMSNGIGTIAGAICPFVVHQIVEEKKKEEWRIVFIISAFIHYAGIIFYGVFASGELQPWADPKVEEEKQWNQLNAPLPVKQSSVDQGLLHRQPSGGASHQQHQPPSYGAVMETQLPPPPSRPPPSMPAPVPPSLSTSNPFAVSSNPFRQETVQPPAEDQYLHGGPQERTY